MEGFVSWCIKISSHYEVQLKLAGYWMSFILQFEKVPNIKKFKSNTKLCCLGMQTWAIKLFKKKNLQGNDFYKSKDNGRWEEVMIGTQLLQWWQSFNPVVVAGVVLSVFTKPYICSVCLSVSVLVHIGVIF